MGRVVMIAGASNTGKSTALRNLKNREKYAYLNGDKKPLPIGGANAFLINQMVENPADILGFYDQLEGSDKCDGIILDTLTIMMSNYHRKLSEELSGFDIWNEYAEFYHKWNDRVQASKKTHIIMAHTANDLNEQTGNMESTIQVKGAVGKLGVEAHQTLVVTTKQMPVGKLESHQSKYLVITERERKAGMKYVFSVELNKESVGDRTRAPFGFWEDDVFYTDNDIQIILDKYDEFYGLTQ